MHAYLLHHLLDHSAAASPDAVAVRAGDATVSYAELADRSARLASALVDHGVRPGDRVALIMDKTPEAIVALYAVSRAGAAYVPIDPVSPAPRAAQIIDRCDIQCAVASTKRATKLLPDLSDTSLRRVVVTGAVPATLAAAAPQVALTAWDDALAGPPLAGDAITDGFPAYLLHTSGSTGVPKGVIISHRNALCFVDMAASYFGVTAGDRLSGQAPLHFDLSVFDLFVAARQGASVVLINPSLAVFPHKLARYIADTGITIWNSVSSVLSLLAERGKLADVSLASMRAVLFSGERLPVKYLRRLRGHMPDARFYNLYGQTEANSSTVYPIGDVPDDDSWEIPIGKPFPNFSLLVLDEHGRPVTGPGARGELLVRAATVALGYWRDPDRTAERFVTDPEYPYSPHKLYRTGDLVAYDDAGNLSFVGRADHLIKSRGYRVELGEVEGALADCPGIALAVVVAVPDELIGNRLVGFATWTTDASLTEADILAHVRSRLPPYMVPETVIVRDTLPRTSSGKLDRSALLQELLAQSSGAGAG